MIVTISSPRMFRPPSRQDGELANLGWRRYLLLIVVRALFIYPLLSTLAFRSRHLCTGRCMSYNQFRPHRFVPTRSVGALCY
jgi:hypothetical protein